MSSQQLLELMLCPKSLNTAIPVFAENKPLTFMVR